MLGSGTPNRKPLSQTPTPNGVAYITCMCSTGVCLNGFFAFCSRTPHDSKHLSRGGAEEKRILLERLTSGCEP